MTATTEETAREIATAFVNKHLWGEHPKQHWQYMEWKGEVRDAFVAALLAHGAAERERAIEECAVEVERLANSWFDIAELAPTTAATKSATQHATARAIRALASAAAPPDANVAAVQDKLSQRSAVGLQKYGVTTERGDLSQADWLRHLQEELMDAAVYVEALLTSAATEREGANVTLRYERPQFGTGGGRFEFAVPKIYAEGDTILVWVNEGDWIRFEQAHNPPMRP